MDIIIGWNSCWWRTNTSEATIPILEKSTFPENTIESVNLAWDNKVKAVEIDIHLSKDNEIVVIHDKDTLRVSGVKKIINETNYDDLLGLNAGKFKGKEWKLIKIPKLQDVLKDIVALFKEIKVPTQIGPQASMPLPSEPSVMSAIDSIF